MTLVWLVIGGFLVMFFVSIQTKLLAKTHAAMVVGVWVAATSSVVYLNTHTIARVDSPWGLVLYCVGTGIGAAVGNRVSRGRTDARREL